MLCRNVWCFGCDSSLLDFYNSLENLQCKKPRLPTLYTYYLEEPASTEAIFVDGRIALTS
jgi:hypothetical protein